MKANHFKLIFLQSQRGICDQMVSKKLAVVGLLCFAFWIILGQRASAQTAVEIEPLSIIPPAGKGWAVVKQTQYGIAFQNGTLKSTAYVSLFSLAKPFTPDEFLAEARRNLEEKREADPRAKVSAADVALTTERAYLCVRAMHGKTVQIDPSVGSGEVHLLERMLFCRSPERSDIGFFIGYSIPPGEGAVALADTFISGVTYVGLGAKFR